MHEYELEFYLQVLRFQHSHYVRMCRALTVSGDA